MSALGHICYYFFRVSPQSRVLCDDSDCDSAELDQSGSGEPSRPPSAGAWVPPSQSYQGSPQVPPTGPP